MLVDLTSGDAWPSADVCIIGAGAAGLVVADTLAAAGVRVVVLESGHGRHDMALQRLNEADSPASYGPLATTRHRQVGGTVNIWNTDVAGAVGAKFVPLDPIDFRSRPWRTDAWPFERSTLDPYYEAAHRLAGLGPFDYAEDHWTSAHRAGFALGSSIIGNSIYQFGTATPFVVTLPERLASAENVQLVTRATVVELETDRLGERVRSVRIVASPDSEYRISARRFVVAAGAIESARLLLASNNAQARGLANSSGLVGCCFMEHPRDHALTLIPADSRVGRGAAFYDPHRAADATRIMGRLALSEAALREANLPNASISLLADAPRTPIARLRRLTRRVAGLATRYPRGGTGWSNPAGSAPERFRLLMNLEQAPDPRNRIVLGEDRDALGMCRARLIWRWRDEEQASLDRLRQLVARELRHEGLGRVLIDDRARPDPRAHHHAGTLRMHDDPRRGVVDRNGRAHDLENLYCAGAAVFTTAGFANPMLTIVALALRLAEHMTTPTAPNADL